jgi:hypothetical protein
LTTEQPVATMGPPQRQVYPDVGSMQTGEPWTYAQQWSLHSLLEVQLA